MASAIFSEALSLGYLAEQHLNYAQMH